MARQTKEQKLIDKQVETAYYKHGNCVQVNIMDIGKIMNMGRDALKAGTSLDDAMITAIAQFRQN